MSNGDSMEEKVGYLRSQSEENKSDLIRIEQKLDILTEVVNKKFTTAETVFRILKFTGVVVVAVITFKFGDIREWWNYLFQK